MKFAVAAYGVFTVLLYGAISIYKGTFFQKRTERQLVELQIGRYLVYYWDQTHDATRCLYVK